MWLFYLQGEREVGRRSALHLLLNLGSRSSCQKKKKRLKHWDLRAVTDYVELRSTQSHVLYLEGGSPGRWSAGRLFFLAEGRRREPEQRTVSSGRSRRPTSSCDPLWSRTPPPPARQQQTHVCYTFWHHFLLLITHAAKLFNHQIK